MRKSADGDEKHSRLPCKGASFESFTGSTFSDRICKGRIFYSKNSSHFLIFTLLLLLLKGTKGAKGARNTNLLTSYDKECPKVGEHEQLFAVDKDNQHSYLRRLSISENADKRKFQEDSQIGQTILENIAFTERYQLEMNGMAIAIFGLVVIILYNRRMYFLWDLVQIDETLKSEQNEDYKKLKLQKQKNAYQAERIYKRSYDTLNFILGLKYLSVFIFSVSISIIKQMNTPTIRQIWYWLVGSTIVYTLLLQYYRRFMENTLLKTDLTSQKALRVVNLQDKSIPFEENESIFIWSISLWWGKRFTVYLVSLIPQNERQTFEKGLDLEKALQVVDQQAKWIAPVKETMMYMLSLSMQYGKIGWFFLAFLSLQNERPIFGKGWGKVKITFDKKKCPVQGGNSMDKSNFNQNEEENPSTDDGGICSGAFDLKSIYESGLDEAEDEIQEEPSQTSDVPVKQHNVNSVHANFEKPTAQPEMETYASKETNEKSPKFYVGLDILGLPGNCIPLTDAVHSVAEQCGTDTCGLPEVSMMSVDTDALTYREACSKRLNSLSRKDLKAQSLTLKVELGNTYLQSEKSKFHDVPLRPCVDGMKKKIDAFCGLKEFEKLNWRIAPELPVPKYDIIVAMLTGSQTFEPLLDIMTKIADGNAPGPQVTMRYELLRICTLRNYPKDNKPYLIQLAAAGFYYAAEGDEVICYCCGLRRHSWVGTDVPERIHRRINPNCKYLNRKHEFNVPVTFTGTTSNLEKIELFLTMLNEEPVSSRAVSAEEGGNDLSEYAPANPSVRVGASTELSNPKHPQHILKSQRISSFQGWPDSLAHTPEIMAEAGFYYAGFGDCVRCYYCGIGLRHWAQEDNPWIEHARWSKNCAFIKSVKGEEFVNLVQMAVQYSQNEEENQATGTSEETTAQAAENKPNERELVDTILKSDPAQSVLELGYQPKVIKKAIEFILKRDGRPGISSQTIMEKVLEYEEAETNNAIVGELAKMDLRRNDNPSGEAEARSTENSSSKGKENESILEIKDKKKPQIVQGNGQKQSEARTIKEENKKLKEQTLCKICLDKPVCIVFLPCGHLCTCDGCAPAMRVCPICRTDVKGTVKTYMS